MFAVIFISGNLFLWIAGKIAKIRPPPLPPLNFVPHDRTYTLGTKGFFLACDEELRRPQAD